MSGSLGGGLTRLAVVLSVVWIWSSALAPAARGQNVDPLGAPEVFAKVDPYTGGDRDGIAKAGYFSLGPFPFCAGVYTSDIEEALGTRILWVETAHFKIGSTLATYKLSSDKREEKKLAAELDRLRTKFDKLTPPKGKLDPWLRLHLYAQRLEDLYADLEVRLGVTDGDFLSPPAAPIQKGAIGVESHDECPFLGQPMKPTVLLMENTASLGRFEQRWLQRGVETALYIRLPGRSMFTGLSAEFVRSMGLELDTTLHCALAANVVMSLLDGFRDNGFDAPYWFKQGLAHVVSRKIDERFTIYAAGTAREPGDELVAWEPRIHGLVANNFVPSWADMMAWKRWSDLNAQAHLVVWSRVSWLLAQKDFDTRRFWMSCTDPLPDDSDEERARVASVRQNTAMQVCFGKSPRELDTLWRSYVAKNYARK